MYQLLQHYIKIYLITQRRPSEDRALRGQGPQRTGPSEDRALRGQGPHWYQNIHIPEVMQDFYMFADKYIPHSRDSLKTLKLGDSAIG